MQIGPDGALYICDIDNHRVRRLDLKSGEISTVAGNGAEGYSGDGGPALEASLNQPYEVRFDKAGNSRGCTPQNITINEHKDDLLKYDATSVGISTQPIDELTKLSSLRKFSQPILSDNSLKFQENLNIPTFQVENKTMYKRLTLILKESKVIKVFYPVFPPDKHIFEILEWLENNSD